MKHQDFFISDTPPSVDKPVGAQIIGYWYNTVTKKLMEMQSGVEDWVEVADLSTVVGITQEQLDAAIAAHTADEDAHHVLGLTGSKTIAGYTLTFTKGILTGFTPP